MKPTSPLSKDPVFVQPVCNTCKHLNRGTITCAAFPLGIPKLILRAEDKHEKVYATQKGEFVYTKLESDE